MGLAISGCSSQHWYRIMKAKRAGKTGGWHGIKAKGRVRTKGYSDSSVGRPQTMTAVSANVHPAIVLSIKFHI